MMVEREFLMPWELIESEPDVVVDWEIYIGDIGRR